MSSASDISNLFRVVGGDPAQYQEVEQTEQVQGLRGRWTRSAAPVDIAQYLADANRVRVVEVADEEALAAAEPEVAEVPVSAIAADATQVVASAAVTSEAAPVAAGQVQVPVGASAPAVPPGPSPASQTAAEQPVAPAAPELAEPKPAQPETAQPQTAQPQPAAPQPAALSSVFARLLARDQPTQDASPRRPS